MPRAIVCTKYGDPTAALGSSGPLHYEPNWKLAGPPKPGFLRVGVAAASVNYADPLTVQGTYQVKLPLPFVPGSEASGIVLEVGQGVLSHKVGDKVVVFNQGGCYAEEVLVHESTAWKVPDCVDLHMAAAVPVVYGTADLALRHRGQLKQGQTVLVLGAGGGVGVAAVQIAKALGAHVVAVTQGADKVEFLKSQGADVVLDLDNVRKERPLHMLVKQHAPKGVHVVIDPVGGPFFNDILKSVAWGAHIVVIGFAAGSIPQIPANILLVKNTTVHGLFWGSYLQHQPQTLRSSMDDIMGWLVSGKIRPHISHTFPMEDLPSAFKTILERKAKGKILVKMVQCKKTSVGSGQAPAIATDATSGKIRGSATSQRPPPLASKL